MHNWIAVAATEDRASQKNCYPSQLQLCFLKVGFYFFSSNTLEE